MRMFICLVVHPIAVECNEVIGRTNISSGVDKRTKPSKVKSEVFELSQLAWFGKIFLAICRRLMLCALGDASSTLITIVFTSMEEAVMRAFLVEIDTAIRSWFRKPKLEGLELECQQLVWASDIFQSSIAEITSIIVSSFAFMLLQPHVFVLNFGNPGEVFLGGALFIQLLLELLLECVVDAAAMWTEAEHGIPLHLFTLKTFVLCTCFVSLRGCMRGCDTLLLFVWAIS